MWFCERCHRKFELGGAGLGCTSCHGRLRVAAARVEGPVWLMRIRRKIVPWRRRLFGSDRISLAAVLYGVSIVVGIGILARLWFESAGMTRAIAIGWLFWVPWSVYRLALIRWPDCWPENYWMNRLAYLLLLVASCLGVAVYAVTAREVATIRYEDGTVVRDFSTWFGKPYWREVRHWRGPILERSYGGLAPSGEHHGKWVYAPWGERWYWYDLPVTADDYHRRARIMRGE